MNQNMSDEALQELYKSNSYFTSLVDRMQAVSNMSKLDCLREAYRIWADEDAG